MAYVQGRTSIPIPTVLETHLAEDDDGASWIIMRWMPGRTLGACWPTMTDGARTTTVRQLKTYLEQLRSLRTPAPGWTGPCSGGPAYDHQIDNMVTSTGAVRSEPSASSTTSW